MLTESVAIPSSYFMKMAIIDYSNWKHALIREFFQNSIDAGCTEIHCSMDEEEKVLRVIDNGHGMTESVIRNSLLTLGGSAKQSGSIGGLGKAKEILYFSWPTWEIRSNTILVKGSGSQFSLNNEYTYLKGTSSAILLPSDVVSYNDIYDAVHCVVAHSVLNVKVFWNNCLIKSEYPMIELGQAIGDIPLLGKLHVNTGSSRSNEVVIQSRGLFMFSRFLPTANRVNYIFNIEVASYESLTSNRDGFIRDYREKFDQLISKLTMNPSNMDYNKKIVIPIVDRSPSITLEEMFDTAVLDNMKIPKALRNNSSYYDFPYITKHALGFSFENDKLSAISLKGRRIREFYIQYSKMFSHGFIIISEHEKMDNEFFLRFLKPEILAMAKLWQKIVNRIYQILEGVKYYPHGTGFITLPDSAAYNYNKWVCVNPFNLFHKSIEEIISRMYVYAIHEITHNYCADHNQAFIDFEEELFVKLLYNKTECTEEKLFYNRFLKKANSLCFGQ